MEEKELQHRHHTEVEGNQIQNHNYLQQLFILQIIWTTKYDQLPYLKHLPYFAAIATHEFFNTIAFTQIIRFYWIMGPHRYISPRARDAG